MKERHANLAAEIGAAKIGKPGVVKEYWEKHKGKAGIATLAAAIGVPGVYYGSKKAGEYAGERGSQTPKKKIVQKEPAAGKVTDVFSVGSEVNMSELARQARGNAAEERDIGVTAQTPSTEELSAKIKANMDKRDEETDKKIAAATNAMATQHAAEIARVRGETTAVAGAVKAAVEALKEYQRTNVAAVVTAPPAPKTYEEKLKERFERIEAQREMLRGKERRGETITKADKISGDDALFAADYHRRAYEARKVEELIRQRSAEAAQQAEVRQAQPQWLPPAPRGIAPGRAYGGNMPAGLGEQPVFLRPQSPRMENPHNLPSPKLEEAKKIYNEIVRKVFPKDTSDIWDSIKDSSASDLMEDNKIDGRKANKKYDPLRAELKRLETATGLKPENGVTGPEEPVGKYLNRIVESAVASDSQNNLK